MSKDTTELLLMNTEVKKIKNKGKKSSIYSDVKLDKHEMIEIIASLTDSREHLLKFDDVVIESTLTSDNAFEQMDNIVNAFNRDNRSIMTSSVFGKRINSDQFRLVALNKQPELVAPGKHQLRKQLFPLPSDETEEIGTFEQTELFFGKYGSYVVNVPIGHLALGWKGNVPVILSPGPHVIHDPNFKTIKKTDLVSMIKRVIQHGTYSIVRVPQGYVAKITINTVPYFLIPSEEPYVFNEPVFTLEKELTKLSDNYISYFNYHIIQVPHGKVAKIWFGAKPSILEANSKPYIFNDPTFKLSPKNDTELFIDATEEAIIHGSIKRIMPKTGYVAVTYDKGKLVTFDAPGDDKDTHDYVLITSPNHSFNGFLQVNTQTIEFPSHITKERRRKEMEESMKTKSKSDDMNLNDVNYEIFRTSDGLPIGVKLLVVFKISDPVATLRMLNKDQIIPHIENLVVADMGFAVQSSSSVDFLKSTQGQARPTNKTQPDLLTNSSASEFYEHLQDLVKNRLHDDFLEYGITLVRLNIETPKVLDNTIATKMAEFSLMNTQARAKESVLERNLNITKQEANQEAIKKQIAQEQENRNKISQAETEFSSAQLIAKATLEQAKANIEAERMALELAEKRAALFDKYPGLLQFELQKLNSESAKGINATIVSPEVAQSMFGLYPSFRIPGTHAATQNK